MHRPGVGLKDAEMEERLGKVEEKIGDIRSDQSAIKENLAMMGKTMETLADVRSETLHIIKQQEQDRKDHDEIFQRLRTSESGRAAHDEKHKVANNRIDDLEGNQRWGVITVLGLIIVYVFKRLFF